MGMQHGRVDIRDIADGFQRAEYLLEHGMVDMVIHRHQIRSTVARLCSLLGGDAVAHLPPAADVIEAEPV